MHLVTNQNSDIMAKTPKKAKEPIRLRFKELADGNRSIYLDTYRNGKRKYEFLKLYLVPETTPLQKKLNADTMKAANAIKAQRIIELANDEAGIKNTQRGKMLLVDWLKHYKKLKEDKSEGLQQQINFTITLVKEFEGDKTRLCDIDKEYCRGFLHYITGVYETTTRKHLEPTTAHNYYTVLNSALNEAVRREYIAKNPFQTIPTTDKIKIPESKRTYLTVDEVKALIATPCRNEAIKQAYLFSVFCGLRISDIERLRWGDIVNDGGQLRANIIQKKTKSPLYVPLSKHAVMYMPNRGTAAATDNIFNLPSQLTINNVLRQWAAAAGITKNVTFHTARHTAATMMLTAGSELYTVSKILGHSEVRTTQIYAKIIDKKKDEAVSLVDNLFND